MIDLSEAKLKVILALASVGTASVMQRALIDFDPSYAIFSVIGNIIIYLIQLLSDKQEQPKVGEMKYWCARLALGAILSIFLTKYISQKTGLNDILIAIVIGIFCENAKDLINIFKKVGISAWESFLNKLLKKDE